MNAVRIEVEDFKGDAWDLVPWKYRKGALWCFCNEVVENYTLVPLPVFSDWWPAEQNAATMVGLHPRSGA